MHQILIIVWILRRKLRKINYLKIISLHLVAEMKMESFVGSFFGSKTEGFIKNTSLEDISEILGANINF